jgi:hypothetical protein
MTSIITYESVVPKYNLPSDVSHLIVRKDKLSGCYKRIHQIKSETVKSLVLRNRITWSATANIEKYLQEVTT